MIFVQINNITYLEYLQDSYLGEYQSPEDFLSELEERLASGEITQTDVETIIQDQLRKSK